jgi:hypothetical protein
MSFRIGWSNLSEGQRDRYTGSLGQGNAKLAERLYTSGAPLGRARGHYAGAARPAEPKPKPAPRVRRRMEKLQDRTRLNRAVLHFAANASSTRKHGETRSHGQPDENKIRDEFSRYTDDQLDQIARMAAADQLRWERGEAEGPGGAAIIWYHGSQGWGA